MPKPHRASTLLMREIERRRGRAIKPLLRDLYEQLGSTQAVAAELSYTDLPVSHQTVWLWMRDLDLPLRRPGHKHPGNRKPTAKIRSVEAQYGLPIEVLLRRLLEEHGSNAAVARHLSEDPSTVWRWMRRFGISTSTKSNRVAS